MNSSLTDKKEIRKFGTIALIFFGTLFIIGVWRQKVIITSFFGVLACLGTGFVLLPGPLRPVYYGWLTIAHFIGRGTTIIILTLAYYLVITPAAWLKRIFGGRPLPLSPDKNLTSYWVDRTETAQPRERFIKRY